jgi:hypothetical protein
LIITAEVPRISAVLSLFSPRNTFVAAKGALSILLDII